MVLFQVDGKQFKVVKLPNSYLVLYLKKGKRFKPLGTTTRKAKYLEFPPSQYFYDQFEVKVDGKTLQVGQIQAFDGVRGNSILKLLDLCAKAFDCDKIRLQDASELISLQTHCKGLGANGHLKFALEYIHAALKGISWYNAHGYLPEGTSVTQIKRFYRKLLRTPVSKIVKLRIDFFTKHSMHKTFHEKIKALKRFAKIHPFSIGQAIRKTFGSRQSLTKEECETWSLVFNILTEYRAKCMDSEDVLAGGFLVKLV